MKKRNKMAATVLAAVAIAVMLPMGSVQALKKMPVMIQETETEAEKEAKRELVPKQAEEPENTELETEIRETETSETGEVFDEASGTELDWEAKTAGTEPIESEVTIKMAEAENERVPDDNTEPDAVKTEEQILYAAQGISVKVEDNIQKALVYESNQYVKKIVHTITLTRNEKTLSLIEPFSTTADIYEKISYVIYRKTDEGEIRLEEGFLEIPSKLKRKSVKKIETAYTQSGDYCIRIKGTWKEDIEVELSCYNFSIEKETQKLSLKKGTQNLDYGEIVYIDNLANVDRPYVDLDEYEIKEESGEKNHILEIGKKDGRIYVKAIGLNSGDKGITTVTIRIKESALMAASDERTLKVIVSPVRLTLKAQTDVSEVHMYDTLAVKVEIQRDGEDVTRELLNLEKHLLFHFVIKSDTNSYEITSKDLECETGSPYIFYIPVNRDYFKEFSKGAEYYIAINIIGDEETECLPYKANTVTRNVTLIGRRAKVKLSAEQDGVYDYRTYYGKTQPSLFAAIEDTTVEGSGRQNALIAEEGEIGYRIIVADSNVVSVDPSKQYTTKDERIPLELNGTGTTTLTITADESSVYTVESSAITITVKDSPLYDEDFVISVTDRDTPEGQRFVGDVKQTGFEKWQAYLNRHNGWINGSVQICLTEVGCTYYNLLNLAGNECQTKTSEQLCIDSDSKKTKYELWMENSSTRANTKDFENGEKGVRSFELGIDTEAPVIAQFVPSADHYAPASAADKQYFSGDFVLTGSFTDDTSGVASIEYTTDINAKDGVKWILLEEQTDNGSFKLTLGNGIYPAIAVRAIDAAGNICEPVCLKNENGVNTKVIVDSMPPDLDISVTIKTDEDTWQAYSADNENWTNREIRFQITEKAKSSDIAEDASFMPVNGIYAGLYKVECAYQGITAALRGEAIDDEQWQELTLNEQGIAEFTIGGDKANPVNKNGYYYFRSMSGAGVKSETYAKQRILLWQEMADKKPVRESGVDYEKCHNEWYNKASGTPIIDFAYPEYDTGVISGGYAAPVTVHYNLSVKDEKNYITSLVDNKTATICADVSKNISATGFPLLYDDISEIQVKLSDDGIYTLEYWITDAAGNKSETDILTYKTDCHEPTGLKLVLDGEEQTLGNDSTLIYEKFYQNSVSGEVSAEYGISGKGSIKLLKAKRIGDWNNPLPMEDADQFTIVPNMRCLLYVKAADYAGNITEGWTKGIVVDNEAPAGDGAPKMIIEPEGANKHGFFNKDVKVKISIMDSPGDGNSAGLTLVTCSVGTDGENNILDKELFSSTKEHVSESVMSETESFSIVETIDAKENEGNRVYINVNATDRSGNMSADTQELKIDVTKPEIEITFDNENAINDKYYNTDRRAKINIKELNFDSALVKMKVTRDGEDLIPSISEWQSDKNNHYAYIDFSADGDYTLTVECMDLADNEADKKSVKPFTIDKTMPQVQIALESADTQKLFYNETQTAVITVTEHNFNADDFRINVQPGGKFGLWEHKNDMHVIKVELLSEGEYAISCDYKDLAGNEILAQDKAKMPLELVVDKTNPVIEIYGVEDNSANAGTVIPNISVQDINIEPAAVTITLSTGRGVETDIRSGITTALTEGGFLYTLNGLDEKPDDIYFLTIEAADKAGNASQLTYRFSLNRRGSAYDFTGLTKLMDSYYNNYNNLQDIKIVEMNVDKVEEFALYLSHNADIIYGKSGSRPLPQDMKKQQEAVLYSVDVSGNEETGYVYTYTVYRENFAREGLYQLGIYSKDKAGNEVNNLLKQNGEEIRFVVDNTMPRVVIDGVESNEIYDVDSREVHVFINDNFKLAEAELTLVNKAGDVLQSWNYLELVEKEGDTALITLNQHNEEVSLLYRAVDAAGNEVETLQGEKEAKADFLVTTNKFVQLVNKPAKAPVGREIIIALILSLAAIALSLVILKKTCLKKRK